MKRKNVKRLLSMIIVVLMMSNVIGCSKKHKRPTHENYWEYGEDLAKIEDDGVVLDQRYMNSNCGFAFTAPDNFQMWGCDDAYDYFASSQNTTRDALKNNYHNNATGLLSGSFNSDGFNQAELAYVSITPSAIADFLDESTINKTVKSYLGNQGLMDGVSINLEETKTNEVNGVKVYETFFDASVDYLDLSGCLSIFSYDELIFAFYDMSSSDVTTYNSEAYQFEFLK